MFGGRVLDACRMREGTGIVMFTDLSVRLSNEASEQIDGAIESTLRSQIVKSSLKAVEYALANMKEESGVLMLTLEDESVHAFPTLRQSNRNVRAGGQRTLLDRAS
jgi:hypothetical protein